MDLVVDSSSSDTGLPKGSKILKKTSDRDFFLFFEVFVEIRRKFPILVNARALWIVREVESYPSSKFQPPTTLGDHQNVEKTIRKKFDLVGLGNQLFVMFPRLWRS